MNREKAKKIIEIMETPVSKNYPIFKNKHAIALLIGLIVVFIVNFTISYLSPKPKLSEQNNEPKIEETLNLEKMAKDESEMSNDLKEMLEKSDEEIIQEAKKEGIEMNSYDVAQMKAQIRQMQEMEKRMREKNENK